MAPLKQGRRTGSLCLLAAFHGWLTFTRRAAAEMLRRVDAALRRLHEAQAASGLFQAIGHQPREAHAAGRAHPGERREGRYAQPVLDLAPVHVTHAGPPRRLTLAKSLGL